MRHKLFFRKMIRCFSISWWLWNRIRNALWRYWL